MLIPMTMAVFRVASWCQNKRTTQERQEYELRMSLVVAFINTAVVLVLASYKSDLGILKMEIEIPKLVANLVGMDKLAYDASFLKAHIPIFQGQYRDTTVAWHFEVGLNILISLVLYLILSLLLRALYHCCWRRCKMKCDRSCCCKWVQKHGTRQKTQYDLNWLHAGSEFNLSRSYSIVHLVTWICLTFSSTMPIFYAVGFIFYFLKYWFDKCLVLNYHKKPASYNEQLSFNQVKFFKVGIIMHIFFSLLNHSSN